MAHEFLKGRSFNSLTALLYVLAYRYQVMDFLGSAAFSRAVQALDVKTGQLVCLKIIKVRRSI